MNYKKEQSVFTYNGHIYSISDRVEGGHRVIVKINEKTQKVVEGRILKENMTLKAIQNQIKNNRKFFTSLPVLEGSQTPNVLN